jgi:hypothetical protein
MAGNELRREELIDARALQSRRQVRKDDRSENDSGGEPEPGET